MPSKDLRADQADTRADKADIRADKSERKAAVDKAVSEAQAREVVRHVDDLVTEVAQLKNAVNKHNIWWAAGTAIVLIIGMIFVSMLWTSLNNQSILKAQGKDNRDILRIVLATSGCKLSDTPEQCRATVQKASQIEGQKRLEVVDCITRSIVDKEPKPLTDQRCR